MNDTGGDFAAKLHFLEAELDARVAVIMRSAGNAACPWAPPFELPPTGPDRAANVIAGLRATDAWLDEVDRLNADNPMLVAVVRDDVRFRPPQVC